MPMFLIRIISYQKCLRSLSESSPMIRKWPLSLMNQNEEAMPDVSKDKAPRENLPELLLSALIRSCLERKLGNQAPGHNQYCWRLGNHPDQWVNKPQVYKSWWLSAVHHGTRLKQHFCLTLPPLPLLLLAHPKFCPNRSFTSHEIFLSCSTNVQESFVLHWPLTKFSTLSFCLIYPLASPASSLLSFILLRPSNEEKPLPSFLDSHEIRRVSLKIRFNSQCRKKKIPQKPLRNIKQRVYVLVPLYSLRKAASS